MLLAEVFLFKRWCSDICPWGFALSLVAEGAHEARIRRGAALEGARVPLFCRLRRVRLGLSRRHRRIRRRPAALEGCTLCLDCVSACSASGDFHRRGAREAAWRRRRGRRGGTCGRKRAAGSRRALIFLIAVPMRRPAACSDGIRMRRAASGPMPRSRFRDAARPMDAIRATTGFFGVGSPGFRLQARGAGHRCSRRRLRFSQPRPIDALGHARACASRAQADAMRRFRKVGIWWPGRGDDVLVDGAAHRLSDRLRGHMRDFLHGRDTLSL